MQIQLTYIVAYLIGFIKASNIGDRRYFLNVAELPDKNYRDKKKASDIRNKLVQVFLQYSLFEI